MRFGAADTDELYDNCILPVVKDLNFSPVRIDRKNHNDYIDRRILQEIDGAHLAVVDLTYARPSVYYEAGYAEAKGLPVVYTVRADHLSRFAEDTSRVHFDLAMKNIISWEIGKDIDFRTRLRERISLVSRPIVERFRLDHERRDRRIEFGLLSAENREGKLRAAFHDKMLRAGYQELFDLNKFGARYMGKLGRYKHFVFVHAVSRFQISNISDIVRFGLADIRESSKHIQHAIILCENSIGPSAVSSRLSWYQQVAGSKSFFDVLGPTGSGEFAQDRRRRPKITSNQVYARQGKFIRVISFIDSCKSVEDMLEQVDELKSSIKRCSVDCLPG